MKIALINENSQIKKNEIIYKILDKVAKKYGHTVYNFGVSLDNEVDMDYVSAGFLCGLLLNAKVVDFVVGGCASGQGFMLVANSMPNVECGFISSPVDMSLFLKINSGNAISIPYGKIFGVGMEYNLELIFETLFQTAFASGYPVSRKEIQERQRQYFRNIKTNTQGDMYNILESFDKDRLASIVKNDYFEENFFAGCEVDELRSFLKDFIDNI